MYRGIEDILGKGSSPNGIEKLHITGLITLLIIGITYISSVKGAHM